MAKKNDNENGKHSAALDFGDLGVLRSIIIGPILKEFEERFDELEAKIERIESSMDSKFTSFNAQSKDLKLTFNKDLEQLEQKTTSSINNIDEKILTESKVTLQTLGSMLEEMGRKLKD